VAETERELNKITSILSRYAGVLARLGLPPNINDAMVKFQQFIALVHMAQATMQAFMLASGPIGWLGFGAGLASTVLGVADLAMEFE